jgi:hypothetical protein
MRILVFCAVVLSCGIAFTQQAGPAASKPSSSPEVTASKITIKGCVQGTRPGHFTLLQASTGATFEVQGNIHALKHSSGKLVEVKAMELAPTAKRGMQSLPRLNVSNLRIVANQCPIQGYGKGAPQSDALNHARRNEPPVAATPRYQQSGAPGQTPPTAGTNPNGAGVSGAPSPGTGNPPNQ